MHAEASDTPAVRASRTFDAAAEHFDSHPLGFWERFGAETVRRLRLPEGASVLDVCCGTGASALEAARIVGPQGRVRGLDVSPRMLERARAKAAQDGLGNVVFGTGDLERLDVAEGAFDAVVCVFGVFFAADMPGAVRGLWRAVRPGGLLAVTTWGAGPMQPAMGITRQVVAETRPDLAARGSTGPRTESPEALEELLREGGVPHPRAELVAGRHRCDPADWWLVVLGSGARDMVAPLAPAERDRVRERVRGLLEERGVAELRADVIYATARKATGA